MGKFARMTAKLTFHIALGLKRKGNLWGWAIFTCLILLPFSAFAQQIEPPSPPPAAKPMMTTKAYIDSFKVAAMIEMKAYGIPASITLGQGILESASGNSKLARECNNHFGVKCRSTWTGRYCLADDDAKDECFRGYLSPQESYRDHSLFLYGSKRYARLFELPSTDYKNWAHGLRETGYATNPSYGNLLIGVIEKYRLAMFDSMVVMGEDFYAISKPGAAPIPAEIINGLPAIMAKPGETPEQLAARYNLDVAQIYKYNDIAKGEQINPGEIIYLKPKKRRSDEVSHTVKSGESMRDISQMYGIRMKHLYKLNKLTPGQEAAVGEVINLRDKRAEAPKVKTAAPPTKSNEISAVDLILNQQKVGANGGNGNGSGNSGGTVGGGGSTIGNNGGNGAASSNGGAGNYPNASVYEVQPGETLQQIAQRLGVTALNIARWNNLEMLEVTAGQILVLKPNVKPSGSSAAVSSLPNQSSVNPPAENTFHFVQPGETLYAISRKYGVSVDQIKALNNLPDNQIRVGQRLRIR